MRALATASAITAAGRAKMAEVASDQSTDWQGLGVSILHRLVMDNLLGAKNLPAPKYVHAVEEVVEGLEMGDAAGRDATGQEGQGGKFNLAALVMPATLAISGRSASTASGCRPKARTFIRNFSADWC